MKPGSVFSGWSLRAIMLISQAMPWGSAHMGAMPTIFSLPGIRVHVLPLAAGRRRIGVPSGARLSSMTLASLVIWGGPESMARAILHAFSSSIMLVGFVPGGHDARALRAKLPDAPLLPDIFNEAGSLG